MNQLIKAPLPGTLEDPRYPDSNGRFMGETDYHNIAMTVVREAIEDHLADVPDVYVASNLVFYWKPGDARRRRDPDVLVAKGVGKHRRRSYRLWEEGKLPCTLFEISSRRSWRVDLRKKPELYADIGIKEYFLFDPEGRYLKPVLQGFRGVKGKPVAMKPDNEGCLISKQLGVKLVPDGELLRLVDLATGEMILTRGERADQQKQRADALAVEVERLRKRLKELNGA